MLHRLDPNFSAAPQIALDDVARAREAGIGFIVNNRPDGEDPSAPQSADIEARAKAEGLGYAYIPVTPGGFTHAQVDALEAILAEQADRNVPVLGYCRSGTRSTFLWALTRARMGDDVDNLVAKAAQNGYDVTPIRAMMDALANG